MHAKLYTYIHSCDVYICAFIVGVHANQVLNVDQLATVTSPEGESSMHV